MSPLDWHLLKRISVSHIHKKVHMSVLLSALCQIHPGLPKTSVQSKTA